MAGGPEGYSHDVPVLISILILIALAVSVAAVIVMRRRPATCSEAIPTKLPNKSPVAEPPPLPMNNLESALAHVTDRTGRPIRDHIDAETGHIDELRVPDDTGPLLRRALDHVVHPAAEAGDEHNEVVNTDNADNDDRSTPEF